MKSLNRQERKKSILRFIGNLLITLFFIVSIVIINLNYKVKQNVNQDILIKAIEEQQKINVLFLIDASPMMSPYFSVICESILEISNMIISNDSIDNIRFASAIYRDAVEGAWAFQHSNLRNSTASVVTDWLNDVTTIDTYDQDEPEALYYGLMEGLMLDFYKESQTNVLILLGGAGDHAQDKTTEVDPDSIVFQLSKYLCNVSAFQIYNKATTTYDEFLIQLRDEILYPYAIHTFEEVIPYTEFEIDKPAWLIIQKLIGTSYVVEDGRLSINELHVLNDNKRIDPNELKLEIINFMQKIKEENHHRHEALEKLINHEDALLNGAEALYLLKILKDLGLDDYDLKQLCSEKIITTN